MRIQAILLALMLAFGVATAVRAEGDEGRRLALARELVDLTEGENIEKAIHDMSESQLGAMSNLPQAQREWVREEVPDMITRHAMAMIDAMTAAMAEVYTADELQAQIDFYRTPLGHQIAGKTLQLGIRMGEATSAMQQAFFTEMTSKFCAQFNCPGTNGVAAPRKPL